MADTLVVGKLRAILGMDSAQYEAGARKAITTNAQLAANMKGLQGQVSQLQAPIKAIGVAWGAFTGSFAASVIGDGIRALVRLGEQAIKTAGDLVDMSARTGISIGALQEMDFVAGQTGASLEDFTRAAFQLGVRLNSGSNSVAGAVKELGLSLKDLRSLRPEDQLAAVLEAMGKIDDAGRRNELGVRLFGRAVAAVLPAAAEGYAKLAAQAQKAGDEQVQAIDKIADAWAGLMKRISTGAVQLGGSFALGLEAIQKMTAMERMQTFLLAGAANPLETIIKLGEARAKVLAEQANAQKAADSATKAATVTETDYVKQLALARKELAALTPEQRRQIAAAQALGVSTDDLEDKYGLTAGVLRLMTTATKDYNEAAREQARINKEIAESKTDVIESLLDSAAKLESQIDKSVIENDRERLELIGDMVEESSRLGEQIDSLTERSRREAEREAEEWAQFQSQLGDQGHSRSLRESTEAMKKQIDEIEREWQRMVDNITFGFTDGLADMLVGLRGFKDAMVDIWRGIRQAIANILSQMLADFIGGYVRRAVAAMAGTALAGVTLGAGSAAAAGLASGAAAGGAGAGVAGGAGAGGMGATLAGLASNPLAWAVAGGVLLGWGIGKKGWFRGGEEGTQVNPRRDQFIGQFGPSGTGEGSGFMNLAKTIRSQQLFGALTRADTVEEFEAAQAAIVGRLGMLGHRGVKSFAMGGFVAPGTVQPAILHGGSKGEWVIPGDKMQPGRVVNNYVTIQSWDQRDFRRAIAEDLIPELNRASQRNTSGYATEHRKGFGIRAR